MDYIVRNCLIDSPIMDILQQVKLELKTNKLSNIEQKNGWVSVQCPFHSDGQEAHNSCGIISDLATEKLYGSFHCFSCGESGNLAKFIGGCFDEDEEFGEEWLVDRFGDTLVERVDRLPDTLLKPKPVQTKQNIPKLDYSNLINYHPYMTTRKLTQWVIQTFQIKYDKSDDTIVFPVWDEYGDYVFYTKRSVHMKRFFIPEDVDKPVYLLNFIEMWNIKTVVVCESQINALTLWGKGIPAIALFGTGSNTQMKILEKSSIRHYILAFDGDKPGHKGQERFYNYIRKHKPDIMIDAVNVPDGEDINSLDDNILFYLFKEYFNLTNN